MMPLSSGFSEKAEINGAFGICGTRFSAKDSFA
jgi:hypothetical protein